jgi:hypothetical protein
MDEQKINRRKPFIGRAFYEHLLGIVPDIEIAKKYKITASSVRQARLRRGIPRVPRRIDYEHLLGVIPAPVIAKMYGVTKAAVHYERQKRGIPPVQRPHKITKPAKERVRVP